MAVFSRRYRDFEVECLLDGTFDPILPSSNEESVIELVDFDDGIIHAISVSCDSTNYNFSLFSEPSASLDSFEEILRVEEVDLDFAASNLGLPFRNTEIPVQRKIYARVYNNGVMSTGTIKWSTCLLVNKVKVSR